MGAFHNGVMGWRVGRTSDSFPFGRGDLPKGEGATKGDVGTEGRPACTPSALAPSRGAQDVTRGMTWAGGSG